MDSFEINKIVGAVLATLVFTMGLSILGESIYSAEAPHKPGFAVAVAETTAPAKGDTNAAPKVAMAEVMPSADPKRGEAAFKPCATCHSVGKGEAAKVGPNLWDVYAGKIAHADGYQYSAAVKGAGDGGKMWTAEALYAYLEDPKNYLPGNKMAFPGLKKAQERADVIAYLRSLSDAPKPMP